VSGSSPTAACPARRGALTKVGTGTLTLSASTLTPAPPHQRRHAAVDGSTVTSSSPRSTQAARSRQRHGRQYRDRGRHAGAWQHHRRHFRPLTVQGNLSFTAASTYMIQVSRRVPADQRHGHGDTRGARGRRVLDGHAEAVQDPVRHGGVNGTFNPTVVVNSPNIQARSATMPTMFSSTPS